MAGTILTGHAITDMLPRCCPAALGRSYQAEAFVSTGTGSALGRIPMFLRLPSVTSNPAASAPVGLLFHHNHRKSTVCFFGLWVLLGFIAVSLKQGSARGVAFGPWCLSLPLTDT